MLQSIDDPAAPAARHWIALFEDRYGTGSYQQLLTELNTPCTSFAAIAGRYGVTRERVRQWHLQLLPGAPRGHARRRLCVKAMKKRALLADPAFRWFYRRARQHFQPQAFALIAARDGFRKRSLRLNGRHVAIRTARPAPTRSADSVSAYLLPAPGRQAHFVFYQLTDDSYLFVPANLVPRSGTTHLDREGSKYWPFRNNFATAHRFTTLGPVRSKLPPFLSGGEPGYEEEGGRDQR